MAHWSREPAVCRSASTLLEALRASGYRTVLVSTAECPEPLSLPEGATDIVVRRPNVAYDFGSWAVALRMCPQLTTGRTVLMVNDSLVGPFGSLDGPLDHLHSSRAKVWGLVASDQFDWHLQSYFVAFGPDVLRIPPVARFWRGVRDLGAKQRVIHAYEIGLSKVLIGEGIPAEAYLPAGAVVGRGLNPMIAGWRRVLDLGVPFVKRELVLNPGLAEGGHDLPGEVRERFGTDVFDWLGGAHA